MIKSQRHPPYLSLVAATLMLGLCACSPRPKATDALAKAESLLQQGDYAAAAIEAKNTLQQNPSDGSGRMKLARVQLALAQYAAAAEQGRRAIDQGVDLNEAAPLVLEALLLDRDEARFKEFAATLGKAAAPIQALAMTYEARNLAAKGRFDEAAQGVQKALVLAPGLVAARAMDISLKQARGGDMTQALADAQALLQQVPADFDALALLAQLQAASNQAKAAITSLNAALKIKPYVLEQRATLIRLQVQTEDLEGARASINALRKLAPNHFLLAYFEGLLAYAKGDLNSARQQIMPLADSAPRFVPGLELGAELALKNGEFAIAERHARNLLAVNPKGLTGARLLASAYLGMNMPEKALQVLAPIVNEGKATPPIHALVGEALIRTGDADKGMKFMEAAAANSDSLKLKLAAANAGMGGTSAQTGPSLARLKAMAASNKLPEADLAIAQSLLAAGQTEQAATLAARYAQAFPQRPSGPYLQGMIAATTGDKEGAARAFAQALSLAPAFLPAAEAWARLDLAAGKFAEAESRYDSVLKANAQPAQVYVSLAQLSAQAGGQDARVMGYFDKAIAASPSDARIVIEKASYLLSSSQAAKAVALLQPLQAAQPDNPQVSDALAEAHEATGEVGKALVLLERQLQAQPDSGALSLRIGQLRLRMGDNPGALNQFQRAASLLPAAIEPKVFSAAALLAMGKRDEAYAFADNLMRSLPDNPVGATLGGDIMMRSGKMAEALALYRKAYALQANPGTARKLYSALLAGNLGDEARAHLRAWWARNPRALETMLEASGLLLDRRDWKEAAAVLNEVLKLNPRSPAALNNAAIAVHQLKDPRAVQLAAKAYELEPGNYAVQDTYGWILTEQGRVDDGLKLLMSAASQAPRSPGIRLHLAQAYKEKGDSARAKTEAQEALRLNPSPDIKAQAEKLLGS